MVRFEETEAVLKKLESFGERASERVFSELAGAQVAST